MLGELAEDLAADGRAGLAGLYRDRGVLRDRLRRHCKERDRRCAREEPLHLRPLPCVSA
jgi:hypothetical protein